MEFEDVSENLEWEARRIAAAFGMREWEATTDAQGDYFCIALEGELSVEVRGRN